MCTRPSRLLPLFCRLSGFTRFISWWTIRISTPFSFTVLKTKTQYICRNWKFLGVCCEWYLGPLCQHDLTRVGASINNYLLYILFYGVQLPIQAVTSINDFVIKWKHFPRNWPFGWGIHRSPVNEFPLQRASYAQLWCLLWSAPE